MNSASKPLALLSVLDKAGIVEFAQALIARGFEIVSTGGTATKLREAGVTVMDVASLTGFPEMLDGRVKTLHPLVHGGLLGDLRKETHRDQMVAQNIRAIQVVAINLYAFEATVSRPHTLDEAIENIDIGGPAMIRSAAKNHANVYVATNPGDYGAILTALELGGDESLRRSLAAKAFRHTAFYDAAIGRYLTHAAGQSLLDADEVTFGFRRRMGFRYGENPHQKGALYGDPLATSGGQLGLAQAEQLWGKELSYNNINDAAAAWELVGDLAERACAIIKHGNPCGAASAATAGESYRLARESDPISAFGGIAAFHGEFDKEAADTVTEKGNFLEVIIATRFTDEALDVIKHRSGWGQDVRLLRAALPPASATLDLKTIRGGAILQSSDEEPTGTDWRVVTEIAPDEAQWEALRFLWRVIPHIRSNAIAVGSRNRLLGVGAGQMNRVQSVRLAIEQAGEKASGACLASDAFFPFPDSIVTAAEAGIKAIIQPGGSKKDPDVIAAANELGIALVLTGTRHFKH